MATEKAPTKADFLAALEKKGIKSLEDLIDIVMPEPDETGGYAFKMDMGEGSDAAGDSADTASSKIDYSGEFGDYIVNMGMGFSNHLKELMARGLH